MLYILIDTNEEKLKPRLAEYESYVSDFFDEIYENSWFEDYFVQSMLQQIDHVKVCENNTLYNEMLGGIVPMQLSSGVKGLILLYKTDCKINGDRLGDNCWEYVMQIAAQKDIDISIRHIPPEVHDFQAVLRNNGCKVDYKEFVLSYARWV